MYRPFRVNVPRLPGQPGPNLMRNRAKRLRRKQIMASLRGAPLQRVPFQPYINPSYRNRNPPRFPRRNPNVPNTSNASFSGSNIRGRGRNLLRSDVSTNSLSKQEYWFDVKPGAHKYNFLPGDSGIPHLDRFSSIYENYQVRYFSVSFRPSAGTTIPGNITAGFDYQPNNERSAKDISLLEPNRSGTIYTRFTMTAVVNRIMKGKTWLPTAAAQTSEQDKNSFALYVNANTESENIGQIWVSYKLAFCTATSPVGAIGAKPIPISMCVSEQVAEKTIAPPTSLNTIPPHAIPKISIIDGTNSVQKPDGQIETSTKFGISQDWPVGEDISVGTITVGENASTPNVEFKYTNGDPVPGDVIKLKTDSSPKIYSYGPPGKQYSILAAIFSVLKPLVRPVVMSLVDSFLPEAPSFNSDEPDPAIVVPAVCTAFAFPGDEATISLPQVSELPFAAKLPFEFYFTMVKQFRPSTTGYTRIYQVDSHSNPDRWAFSWRIEGKQPTQNIAIGLRSPNSDYIFAPGDFIQLNFTVVCFDEGVTKSDGFLPAENIISPENLKIITDYICKESTADDATGYYGDALTLNYVSNRTGSVGRRGITLMFNLNGRANSTTDSIKNITFRIPAYILARVLPSIVPVCGNNPETGYPSPLRPDESLDFTLGACFASITMFPSKPMETQALVSLSSLQCNPLQQILYEDTD